MIDDALRRGLDGARPGAAPAATLIRRPTVDVPRRQWPEEVTRIVEGSASGRAWQVFGAAGTGKTALLADVAVSRIVEVHGDPESVLVLTHSKRAAVAMREQITAALLGVGGEARATRQPLVRTIHSYAFAVLRLQASAHGNKPPRLLTGAEQDAVLREMLRGELADGGLSWPEKIRPALGLVGFAAELRDLLLRSAERGLGPEDLVRWGRVHKRPEWVAAGRFAAQYEQAMILRGSVGMEAPEATAPGLDAAELVGAALTAFATDPELLRSERARVRHVLVDDAQHLDPQAAEIVRLLTVGASSSVVSGDPDQAVFAFRGSDPTFLREFDVRGHAERVVLDHNFRSDPAIGRVTAAVAARLPGSSPTRLPLTFADGSDDAPVRVEVATSTAKEAAMVADTLRRAHLVDGVPWSSMAVVLRSVPRALPPIRRALLAAGVPVVASANELALHRQRGAVALLLVLRAVSGNAEFSGKTGGRSGFTGDDAVALVEGPIGGADPLALRRLRRGLRRADVAAGGDRDSTDVIRSALDRRDRTSVDDVVSQLTDVEAAPLRRVQTVLDKAGAVLQRDFRAVEDTLWAAWQASGLERRWISASERGGPLGAQADRDLDSVVALFDAAANYVDRLPRATVGGFVEYVTDQEIPTDSRSRAVAPVDAVTVLSAHSAAGREWDVVAVAGVQEGLWPTLRARGSLLGVEALVDLAGGVADGEKSLAGTVSRTAPLLADERRLFLLACSRARRRLLVTAVDSVTDSDLVHSRFLDEMMGDPQAGQDAAASTPRRGHVLSLSSLVAQLRSVVCDPVVAQHDPAKHRRAAESLARLAREGVRGAHPDEWYGTSDVSTLEPLWSADDGPVPMSPSTVEQLGTCPLRWALERSGGNDGDTVHAVTGNLVHTLVQAVAGRIPPDRVRAALENAWTAVDLGSAWYSRKELGRTATMLDTFEQWLRTSRSELTEIGVEVLVDGVLTARTPDEPDIRLRGRIDRLERDNDGRPVIIDVKTAKTPVSKSAAAEHAQLATYQVAAAAGAIAGEPAGDPGGARLVFVAKPHRSAGAAERTQNPLSSEDVDAWRDTIATAASATRGPLFEARVNDGCRHCPITSSCPAQDAGRQVSEG
ncbi:ATP-dependent helicase [Actinomycetes bacterium M1A6_2h]